MPVIPSIQEAEVRGQCEVSLGYTMIPPPLKNSEEEKKKDIVLKTKQNKKTSTNLIYSRQAYRDYWTPDSKLLRLISTMT